jgi:hypothetical protein
MHKNEASSIQLIKKWVQNFEESGSTINQPRSVRPRTSRDPVNIERVRASVRKQPGLFARMRSSILNVPKTSLNSILHKDLHLYSYKIKMIQGLKPQVHAQMLQFAREVHQL